MAIMSVILIKKKLVQIKNNLVHLIFPTHCLVCNREITIINKSICPLCEDEFSFTNFELLKDPTKLDKLFWGRVKLHSSYCLVYFEKGKNSQKTVHAFKYDNNYLLASEMGKKIGEKIKSLKQFESLELLLPVPIHPKKEYQRGYNQSEKIANGISEIINIPVNCKILLKSKNNKSQTKKNKFTRWENVKNTFEIDVEFLQKLNHIAIIDDVITTGSTLESIVKIINEKVPHLNVSIISLALTKK
jgi:ComF family protein